MLKKKPRINRGFFSLAQTVKVLPALYQSGFLSSAAASAVGSGVDHLGINSVALYIAAEIASGGLSGGLGSVIAGGDFWRGAEQGVIATAYNHAVHGLYNKITQDSKSPYDGYRKDKNGNYIRVDGRGGDKIDYLYDEEGNIIASTPVSFTEIEVGPYRRTYGQGTKYVSPALYDPSFDIFAWWASGEVLGAALVKVYRYLSGVGRAARASKWVYGSFKSSNKWANQLAKRGWTEKQITEAITRGKSFNAVNNINKANKATRFVHPETGQSIVIDNVTKELLHVGGPGFKY